LLLASHYRDNPAGVMRMAETLAEDPHWEVREAAGGLLGTSFDRDFDRVSGRLEVLRNAKSENLRRAVVLAVKYAARRDWPKGPSPSSATRSPRRCVVAVNAIRTKSKKHVCAGRKTVTGRRRLHWSAR